MTFPQPYNRVQFRLATPDDAHLPAFDNTKLVAINTCPFWGIVRYGLHKVMNSANRAMALEAGGAAHEVYAAIRLWTLRKSAPGHFEHHGVRLFGQENFAKMKEHLQSREDEQTQLINFAIEALYSSGFYDDPDDKRRTLTNIEQGCITYIDRMDFTPPVWIQDITNPARLVGIEVPFDIVVSFDIPVPYKLTEINYLSPDYEVDVSTAPQVTKQVRFIGRIDGIHAHENNELRIHENKTASRLNDAWRQSFYMLHQITGYCIAASLITGRTIEKAKILGMQIPQPTGSRQDGISADTVTREPHMLERWVSWFYHTVSLYEKYIDDPTSAPKYTHSCNRFFRPCSFIPLCYSDDEEHRQIIDEMDTDAWSPLTSEAQGELM